MLETADQHAIYKNGAKTIAGNHGKSLTFMAKFNEREGNSCHIHLSVRDASGSAMAGDGPHGFSTLMGSWIAGILATMREFTLLYAPNINSYKRFAKGSFAPTGIAWGVDNRTCALRIVGHGASLRNGVLAFFDAPRRMHEMLAGMSNCAWTVLEQHRDRGWQIIDYNATTLPEPLDLPDDLGAR